MRWQLKKQELLKKIKVYLKNVGLHINERMFNRHHPLCEFKQIYQILNKTLDNGLQSSAVCSYFIEDDKLFVLSSGSVFLSDELFHHKHDTYVLYHIQTEIDRIGAAFNYKGKSALMVMTVYEIDKVYDTKCKLKEKILITTQETHRPLSRLVRDNTHDVNKIELFLSNEDEN